MGEGYDGLVDGVECGNRQVEQLRVGSVEGLVFDDGAHGGGGDGDGGLRVVRGVWSWEEVREEVRRIDLGGVKPRFGLHGGFAALEGQLKVASVVGGED